MSDLRLPLHTLERHRTQLSAYAYFDPALFQREMELIFDSAPRYVGHELSVAELGDFSTLGYEGDGRALVRNEAGVQLLSNVCRHRQAVMLRGRGNLGQQAAAAPGHIVCPLHRWTYNSQGQLVGAPHFAQDPCLHLKRYETQNWNGLIFEAPQGRLGRHVATDLASLSKSGTGAALDFSGYVFHHAQVHECAYNWKTFIEVYLEDYHVGPFHPGLGQFVTCDNLRWEFGEHHSVQTVGVQQALSKPGSPVYQRWHEQVLRYRNGEAPEHGAIWLTYYPNVMVEWYPHVLVVSTLHPKGPQQTLNVVEFFYPEEIAAFEPDFVEAEQAAYWETCVEDDEIAVRMEGGRRALMERGDDEFGPYQSPMEDGMQHFHAWYRRAMHLET